MMNISDKQADMLAFIKGFVAEHNYPPTYEEIKTGLNISSKSLVKYHLEALENAQLLSRVPNTPRGIRLKPHRDARQMELTDVTGAALAAALPNLSQADVLELTVNCMANNNNLFALQVNSATLADEFVSQGDIVILQGQRQAKNGDLVAIRLPAKNQIGLKRYYRENGHVRLQSPTAARADLVVKPAEVEIQGKVVAVIRQNN